MLRKRHAWPVFAFLVATGAVAGCSGSSIDIVDPPPFNATITPSARIAPRNAKIDFGTVIEGRTLHASVSFSNDGEGTSSALKADLRGESALYFKIVRNSCSVLASGSVCSVDIDFTPPFAGNYTAALELGNAKVDLVGVAIVSTTLHIDDELRFGPHFVGTVSPPQKLTVRNDGTESVGPITLNTSGTAALDFRFEDNKCSGAHLAPGKSCTTLVMFSPREGGLRSASIEAAAGPAARTAGVLTGQGVAPAKLSIGPVGKDFGGVNLDAAAATQSFTVRNDGDVRADGFAAKAAGDPEFSIALNKCKSSLEPGASCTVDVQFKPLARKAYRGSLDIQSSNAGKNSAALSGAGGEAFTLTVTPEGNGSGTVKSDVGGIDCGSKCSSSFAATPGNDPRVTLTAEPREDSNFEGWSLAECAGTAPCTVTLDASKGVTARFRKKTYTLRVSARTVGATGTLSSSPAGVVACTGACEETVTLEHGTSVFLSALMATAYRGQITFHFSGDCAQHTGDSCRVEMLGDRSVTLVHTKYNYAFVTSAKVPGTITTGDADQLCIDSARAAHLPHENRYRAWLSSPFSSAASRLAGARGWTTVVGTPLADTLPAAELRAPLDVDEWGKTVGPSSVRTGTTRDGLPHPVGTCSNGTSATDVGATGYTKSASDWTDGRAESCATSYPIYCFDAHHSAVLP